MNRGVTTTAAAFAMTLAAALALAAAAAADTFVVGRRGTNGDYPFRGC